MQNTRSGLHALVFCFLIIFSSPASAFQAQFGLAPDNAQQMLLSTIRSAKKELLINIYQFDSKVVADALISRVRAGVKLELLIEGEPVERLSRSSREILIRLRDAIADSPKRGSRIYIMTDNAKEDPQPADADSSKTRRFRYNHAKYVLVDSRLALVSSENFSKNGHAKPGEIGNRGWEAVIHDSALTARLKRIFQEDIDHSHGDIVELGPKDPVPVPVQTPPPADDVTGAEPPPARSVRPIELSSGEVSKATLVTAPNALPPLQKLLRSAEESIKLEFMSLPSTWRKETNETYTNPLVTTLIEAAIQGVRVQVLLNDERVWDRSAPRSKLKGNEITALLLQEAARCYEIPLQARIVNTQTAEISYIHNKGILVDNDQVLISSINGTQNSMTNNREVAVLIKSPVASKYYSRAFNFDWLRSRRTIEAPPLLGDAVQGERICPKLSNIFPFPLPSFPDLYPRGTGYLKY